MKLLIDGNNLIYKFPHLEKFMYEKSMAGAREGLIQLMADYRSHVKNPDEILVFFDGRKNSDLNLLQEEIDEIHVYYSHADSADDLIKHYIKMSPVLSDLAVVTSDKDILFYAKRFKVKSYTSEQFAAQITEKLNSAETDKTDGAEVKLDKQEISFWKKFMKL